MKKHLAASHVTLSDDNERLIQWRQGIDICWDELIEDMADECEPEWMNAEDPLFILYTR